MKPVFACAAVLGLALTSGRGLLAESGRGGGAPRAVRPEHDVSCTLRVAGGATAAAGTTVPAKFVVKNRSRRRERSIALSVFADVPYGDPLWTGTVSLPAHRRSTRHLHIEVPEGTTSLVAVAACDGDENPGNNLSGVPVDPGHGRSDDDDDGDDDGGGTLPPPTPPSTPPSPAVLAGAATYASNCASCHGVLGEGGTVHERVVGRSAKSILEAMREGEDDMPRFPGMTWTDAQNLAAFLADPGAATPSSPPVTPPPSGTVPTYAGGIKAYLDANCVVCHTGANAPQSIRLETYAYASANASAALSAIAGLRMPPGNPQSAAAIQLFASWVNGGKPQ